MIHKLELENYIPLLVAGISKISMTLGEVVNLLISLNGSGKSRLLTQMNPLPAENADFTNGRKYIEILLNNRLYKLLSVTGKDGYHSFKIDDGPELNTGGTISVQKKLVQQHFKLNPNLAKVLSGIKAGDLLSNLSAVRRKDVFMELYPNDVDYALSVYNKLKAERNNLKGAIKNQMKNLSEETEKLFRLRESEYEGDLDKEIEKLDESIKEGLVLSGMLSQFKLSPEKEDLFKRFNSLTKKLTLTALTAKPQYTESMIRAFIELRTANLNSFIKLKDHFASLLAECRCQIEELGEGKIDDPATFKEHLASVEGEINRTKADFDNAYRLYKDLPYFGEHEPSETLVVITDEFINYLNRVVDCGTANLTSTEYQSLCKEKEQLSLNISSNTYTIEKIQHQLNHIRNMEDLTCPECTHTFKQGVTKKDIVDLETRVERLTKENELLQRNLSIVSDKVELENDWYLTMKQLTGFLRENDHVKGLTDVIRIYNVGKFESNLGRDALINALNLHRVTLKHQQALSALLEEKNVLASRIALLDKVSQDGLFKKVTEFEQMLLFYTDAVNRCKKSIDELQEELNIIIEYTQGISLLGVLQNQIEDVIENETGYKLKKVLDNKLNLMSDKKNQLMKDVIRKASLETVVEKIEENLASLKRRYLIVTKLMDGLCPNKGLIGKLMTDFIKTVCGNMNALIKEIWNGTLYVKPCSKDNGDLTYKFPVVNGHDSETSDIEDCSDGQCDIINYAFRHVILKYHDSGFPLIMDEIGVKFDEINRNRFFSYINEYVNSGDCKQLFMISHYVNQYESFKHANIIALKYDGLTLTGKVNRNTVIQ
ncbi:SbcC-like subunit of palindrome specific endonuclease [Shewanella phage FishSpeaker]|nr:SbcC-like subunit of palindrome specific endonuclease [Shewanella phage FishSpeaker]